ncbi:MAG TPA: Fe-S cluster assembly protein SufD [Thermoanaerobaculia bacterium]|nr:Fe-S cluster assembly protein SufD [Thermoanaerobaculia bacterium]
MKRNVGIKQIMSQMLEEVRGEPVTISELASQRLGRATWLDAIREAAFDRFTAHGFPTPAKETWKYTNLSGLSKLVLDRVREKSVVAVEQVRLRESVLGGEKTSVELVFVDGHLERELSSRGELPGLTTIMPLSEALEAETNGLKESLMEQISDPLVDLNTSLFEDGAYIHIPAGIVISSPIHLVFLSSGQGMSNPRVVIRADGGSQVSVVETFAGPRDSSYFTNAVTTILAGNGSVIDHYRLQREGNEAFHISNLRIRQSRSSTVTSHVVSLGARLSRQQIEAALQGEGASVTLNGLFILNGRQHADHNTIIDHQSPHSESSEFYKGILDGQSRGIFDGKIIVRKDAQKTSSRQVNRNLLLSPTAIVDSKPQLEIHADDVKCNHGSTIGQIDEDALFYMQARGIGSAEARNLLMYAFASEVVERMKIEPVRDQLQTDLLQRLGGGAGAL